MREANASVRMAGPGTVSVLHVCCLWAVLSIALLPGAGTVRAGEDRVMATVNGEEIRESQVRAGIPKKYLKSPLQRKLRMSLKRSSE